MGGAWDGSDGGVRWHLELDRTDLLPGRLVGGRVRLTSPDGVEARGLVVTLRGEERWVYETTSTDADGHMRTERHTGRQDLPPEPVLVASPISLGPGETHEAAFGLPVPGLGPPTVAAEMAAVEWTVEAKLDIEGSRDSSIEAPVRVVQPVALLRAGVVPVGEFALYPEAEIDGDLAGSIALDPVPLAAGSPFTGRVTLRAPDRIGVRAVRAELRVAVKATVSGGLSETIVAWSGTLAGAGTIEGERVFDLAGTIDAAAPPTTELPHGRVSARFAVVLDRAWAPDTHAGRDVALASTLEL